MMSSLPQIERTRLDLTVLFQWPQTNSAVTSIKNTEYELRINMEQSTLEGQVFSNYV